MDAHLPDDKLNGTIEKFTKLLEKKGNKVLLIDRWGKRRLAYEIAKKQYGYYVYVRFQSEPAFIAELERIYKLDDAILRYLTVIVPPVVLKEEERRKSRKEKLTKAEADAEAKFDSESDRADVEEESVDTRAEMEEAESGFAEEMQQAGSDEKTGEAESIASGMPEKEAGSEAAVPDEETKQADPEDEKQSEGETQEEDGEKA